MGSIVVLESFRKPDSEGTVVQLDFYGCLSLIQESFKTHERKAIGDIQSRLVAIGFSRDPIMNFTAFPDKTGINNKIVLEIDVANPEYQKVFGERFDISISKFVAKDGRNFFKMETPLSKSSGTFGDVVHFVEIFINNNLKFNERPVKALVMR